MRLSVRQAAAMLNVSETQVYRWIDDDEIPFAMIQHHPGFHRVELLEWAMEKELPISADLYEDERDQPLTAALERGGGRTLAGGLDAIAADLPLGLADREVIRTVIAARSRDMFAMRAQLAIPKARSPLVCPDTPPLVMLWWCDLPLAINNARTKVVFLIVAPSIKEHLRLLSRLSLALYDRALCECVLRTCAFDQVVAEARRWESARLEQAR
jgi:excisionase family DNA binding protein